MSKKKTIDVQGLTIRVEPINDNDYVSLTDIAKHSDRNKPKRLIHNWLKNQSTLDFLTTWEDLHNSNFATHSKGIHLDTFKLDLLRNATTVTPQKWIAQTNAIGIVSKSGRYGGTYAHKDVALNFCYWLSPHFQVYLIKEFQRLKEDEFKKKSLEWHISKITDNIDEVRNLLDTIPHQVPERDRIKKLDDNKNDKPK